MFSSRAIARTLEGDVAFRALGAENFPRHRTICEVRRRHFEKFERMFVEVVQVASGVLGANHQAHEGTGGVLNEHRTRPPSGIRVRRHVAHTKRQPSCPCIAKADAATIPKQFCSSVPSGRILNRPAPTIRRHDFCGANS